MPEMVVEMAKIILPPNRVREEYGDLEGLYLDILQKGMKYPLLCEVTKDNFYIIRDGGRRFKVAQKLGWTHIKILPEEEADEVTRLEVEYSIGQTHKEFTWQERVRAEIKLHRAKQKNFGAALRGRIGGGGWGMKDTARIFHVSIPTVSQDLELAEAIEKFPELAREPTRAAALRRLRKMKDGSELPPTIIEAIEKKVDANYTHGSLYSWLDRLEPNSFDLLLTDATEEQDYDRLIKALTRTMAPAFQGFIFFNTENAFPVIQAFRQADFRVSNSPHILVQRGDIEAYINFIWVSKHISEPPAEIKKAETWKTDPNRVHHLDRPLLFLQKIIKAVNATNILDPFAYGGSTFIAAENCEVKCRCFVENEAIYKGGRARLVKFLTPSMRREVSEGEVEEMKKENDNADMQS